MRPLRVTVPHNECVRLGPRGRRTQELARADTNQSSITKRRIEGRGQCEDHGHGLRPRRYSQAFSAAVHAGRIHRHERAARPEYPGSQRNRRRVATDRRGRTTPFSMRLLRSTAGARGHTRMYSSGSVKATARPTTRLVRTDGNPLMSHPGNRGRIHPRCPGCRSTSISPKELRQAQV